MNEREEQLQQLRGYQLPQYITGRRVCDYWFAVYSAKCRLLGTLFKPRWFRKYDPNKLHIDHRLSIRTGYNCRLPLHLVCCRENMQLVNKHFNLHKGTGNSLTVVELKQLYRTDTDLERVAQLVDGLNDLTRLQQWGLYAHNFLKQREQEKQAII